MAGFAPPTRKPGGKPGDRDPFRARGPGRQGNGPWAEHAAPPWAPFLRTFDLGPGVWPVSRSASARANRAETKLPGPSELGLSVSTPSDPAEREADAVAARILEPARAPAAAVSGAPAAPGQIQRQCDACQDEAQNAEQAPEEKVQRHATGAPPVAPGVAAAAGAVSGGGEPLPSDERRFFEARLGHDLSRVRVHADRPAAEAARGIAADAFTLRHAVAFAEGQYRPGTDGGRRLLAHELVHVIQQGQAAPLPGASAPPVRGGGGPRIARLAAGTMETAPASDTARSPSADTPAAAAAAGGLIVDDDARALTAGQVRKSELLAELREASCAAADRELARAGRDTRGCPFVAKWLDHYQDRPAQHLERAIRKYAPGAAAARSAHDYVPLVAARIGQGVATWTSTGQIPRDIPAEMLGEMAGGGLGAAIGGAFSAVTGAIGGALSAIGHLFFKGAPGGARTGADVAGLSARLGPGRALDGATKTRMEGALGGDFGGVRVHDDSVGAGLSRDLNAHAFTLGQHVAFADGTYQPGTPIGDALLAHELAHVVQQSGAAGAAPPDGRGSGDDPTVEQDADRAAAGAVASLHAGVPVGAGERPRVRGGLRLSRCGGSPPPATQTPKQSTSGATGATPGTSGPTPGTAVHPAGETFGDTKQYVREGIDIPQDNARRLLGSSFWQEKLGPDLNVILFPPVSTRFAASAEERDAVLSAVSSRFQAKKPVSSGLPEEPVTIPARGPGTKALTYSLTFLPRDPSTPTDARPRVEVRFRAEGTGATAVPAGAPTGTPATHSDLQFRWNDFPNNNDAEGYFNTFPQEDSQLFSYIQAHPLSASPQIVTTSSTNKLGKVVHESTFAVSGQKPVKVSSDLLIDLAGQSKLQTVTAPQDYASHDAADVELEKPAQDDHQKIGQVRLPPGISADEALLVKDAIFQNFQGPVVDERTKARKGGARNAEVDVIIPVPGSTPPKRLLYTLKFHAKTNDVDAIRVGEAGPAGQTDPSKIVFDLSRIPEFAANAGDVKKLSAWLGKRYPAIKADGTTVAALKADAEAKITAAVAQPGWLEKNYAMKELSALKAEERLRTVHGWQAPQLANLENVADPERKTIEFALESLSDPLLAMVHGISIARQEVIIKNENEGTRRPARWVKDTKVFGVTLSQPTGSGTERTIVFFDSMFLNDNTLFIGGPGHVSPASVETPLHEFGHAIGAMAGIEDAFKNTFADAKAKLHAAPITEYARRKPGTEAFPEAFALYEADPEWMKSNLREMFDWFETVAKTGKPPAPAKP